MSIVVTPTYPSAGSAVTLSLTAASGTGSVVYEIASKPSASELSTGFILSSQASGTSFRSAQAVIEASAQSASFTPDIGGEYGIKAYDFAQYLPNAVHDRTRSATRYELVATQTSTIYTVKTVDLPIYHVNGSGATLRLGVANNTVRSASLIDPSNEIARVSALDTSVVAAVAALVGIDVPNLDDTITVASNDLRTKYEAHRANSGGTFHRDAGGGASPDTTNVVTLYKAEDQASAIELLNHLYDLLRGHLIARTTVATRWHKASDDTLEQFVVAKATNTDTAVVLSAWLRYHVYERHRQREDSEASLEIHDVADTTNSLTAEKPLASAIVGFLEHVRSNSPSAVAGENIGALRAGHLFGFKL